MFTDILGPDANPADIRLIEDIYEFTNERIADVPAIETPYATLSAKGTLDKDIRVVARALADEVAAGDPGHDEMIGAMRSVIEAVHAKRVADYERRVSRGRKTQTVELALASSAALIEVIENI